jgi:hypothetical protein
MVFSMVNLACAASPATSSADVSETGALTSDFLNVDFRPDGDLTKPVWAGAERVRFNRDAFQRAHQYPELETMVASRWTEKYLYLALWCRYVELHTFPDEHQAVERWRLWERDVVEAFVSPQAGLRNRYYEFEVAPNGQWLDLAIDLDAKPKSVHDMQWNSGFEHVTRVDPVRHRWSVEMRIPIASMLPAHLEVGMEWRVNFYRVDGSAKHGDGGQKLLSWRPMPIANGSFHQPASFGVLRFIKAEEAGRRKQ